MMNIDVLESPNENSSQKSKSMNKEQLLEMMPKRNTQGDRSLCIGLFTIDYSKSQDKFYLVYPNGGVREIDLDTVKRYMRRTDE